MQIVQELKELVLEKQEVCCEECNKKDEKRFMKLIHNEYYCNDCVYLEFEKCENCEDFNKQEDLTYSQSLDMNICETCCEDFR